MRMNKQMNLNIGILVILIFCGFSCKHHEEDYHSIIDKIENDSKNYHGVSLSSETFIGDLKTLEITENGITFLIPDRKSEIISYACTECHTSPLKNMNDKNFKKAHWDIEINHANTTVMNCVTCHNGDNMDVLQSLTGVPIDFNASHQLCSQCHQKQYNDWTGGAHGKIIESWATPRASMTCVNCHNPHDPSFKSKWPARYNTQKIDERK